MRREHIALEVFKLCNPGSVVVRIGEVVTGSILTFYVASYGVELSINYASVDEIPENYYTLMSLNIEDELNGICKVAARFKYLGPWERLKVN